MGKTQIYNTKAADKRIAVVGIGGVGGYIAGMLGQVCPHLTLAARGERKKRLEENRLILHSEYKGEKIVRPECITETKDMKEQDIIFLCVKNYSLADACEELQQAVTNHTIIIPVMNGVNPGERVRGYIQRGTVVDSLIYIVAFANEDYSVTQQGNFARLCIGIKHADDQQAEKVEEVAELLRAAGIDFEKPEDIEVEIWRKYILNCAYNVTTAFYDNTIGQLRKDGQKAKEFEDLVREAEQVALAKGVRIKKEHTDAIIHRFYYEYADNATSSLQRDIRAHRKSEADVFSGYIVQEAEKYNIPVPISKKMYKKLCEK